VARYRLRLSYDGGPFRGFAINEGVPTVGGTLRSALEQVLQHDVPIVCAGRTDAGVHALDQVVSFDTHKPVDCEALRTSLNGLCKPHIVVSTVEPVSEDFDARFSCLERSYRYRIVNQRLPDPFREDYTWRVSQPLDVAAMQAAGNHLLGSHDFSSFCRRQFDTSGDEPVEKPRRREVLSLDWSLRPDNEIHLQISATSFCQQMVRSITGLCVDVGLTAAALPGAVAAFDATGPAATPAAEIAASDVPDILAAKDRTRVPRIAPPQGLYLLAVRY